MVARKRGQQEMEEDTQFEEPNMLHRLRNMWEFASLMQYIHLFGKVIRIDDNLDIDELESLCIGAPNSTKFMDVGLALLKFVSSHRGLTPDLFNEHTRRQYKSKISQQNPFGDDEIPNDFSDFDIYTKIQILHQLSVWTLNNPDRIRERLPGKEYDQTLWRMEPLGWDGEGRTYYVLDDNRLYRRTDPPIPAQSSKSQARRSSSTSIKKKRKTLTGAKIDGDMTNSGSSKDQAPNHDYDRMKWECVAISLDDYTTFMQTIRRSRGQEEKALHLRLVKQVMPVIERRAEEQKRKAIRRQKELENVERLATAKRSSRIAGKMERKKQQDEAEEAERKRAADLANAKKEERRLRDLGDARESRIITREQRLKEREMKQILHEEALNKMEQSKRNVENGSNRVSERNYEAEMRKRHYELEQLEKMENWIFDCSVCGAHGENYDDGLQSIACENCRVWQHGECHGISREDAHKEDFHFRCAHCRQETEDAGKPKIAPIKIHLGKVVSPKESKTFKQDISSLVTPEEQDSVNGTSHLHGKGEVGDVRMAYAGEADRPPTLTNPRNFTNCNRSDSDIRPRTPSSLSTGNAATVRGQLLSSGSGDMQHVTGAATLSNGSSVAAVLLEQNSQNEFNHNITVTDGLYKSFTHSPGELQQPNSSPPGRLNGHSSPVKLPPPATPNGYHDAHFNATGDSPIKHAPTSTTQTPAEIITGVISGFSPTKHDSPRPSSASSIPRTQIIPPVTNLSPKPNATIMTPPSKKVVSSPPAQFMLPTNMRAEKGGDTNSPAAVGNTPTADDSDEGLSIEDLALPRTVIARVSKRVLPPNAQIQKQALLAISKSATAFVNYIGSHANENAARANKKTIRPEDVIEAAKELEFDAFVPQLQAALQGYNDSQSEKSKQRRNKASQAEGTSAGAQKGDLSAAQATAEPKGKARDDAPPATKRARLSSADGISAGTSSGEEDNPSEEDGKKDQSEEIEQDDDDDDDDDYDDDEEEEEEEDPSSDDNENAENELQEDPVEEKNDVEVDERDEVLDGHESD